MDSNAQPTFGNVQPTFSQKATKLSLRKKTVFLSLILIIILGFAVYGNSLQGKFIWDDSALVKDNVYIKDFSYIAQIFTQDIGAGAGKKYGFYRPLQLLTYTIDYFLWKLDVRGYHFSNILLHIFAALSIYWLINLIFKDNLLSFLTAIFFVVHPIHTEAVAYISGRADPLALLFLLLTFIFYIKNSSSKSIGIYILMLLSYTLALLSRENSLILPLLLPLYHYTVKKKLNLKGFLPILSLALIYILLRLTVLSFPTAVLTTPPTALLQRLPGFFVALTTYTRLLFLPFNLHMEYGQKLFNLTDPQAISGMLILLSLLIYALRIRKTNTLIFFSLSWFFIALLPVSNLYPINAYMAEHWLYLPSVGVFLILAKGLGSVFKVKRLKTFSVILIISLLAFYSFLTIRQNAYWRGPLIFSERTLKYAPDSSRLYNNLGLAYNALNKKEEAIAAYKKALQINPDLTEAYYNLGLAYNALNKKEEAIAAYKKAIQINPDSAKTYNNLGVVYAILGKNEKAIASYKKAIELNPNSADAYSNLAAMYATMGKEQDAISLWKKALEVNPNHAAAYNNLAVIYYYDGRYELAIKHSDKAIELGHKVSPEFLKLLEPYRK